MKKHIHIIFTLVPCMVLFSCEDIVIGPQPKFIGEDNFQEGLNVFSIVTNQEQGATPLSFAYLERTLPARSEWEQFTITDEDAEVSLIETNTNNIVNFQYNGYDTVSMREIFKPYDFIAVPGNSYKLQCLYNDDTITGNTKMPNLVKLHEQITISDNNLTFSIEYDSTAVLYIVYLISNSMSYDKQFIPIEGENTFVSFNIKDVPKNSLRFIDIYAYDANLAEYLSTTNVFIMPNAYRPIFSTIENGFGVFGAITKTEFTLGLN